MYVEAVAVQQVLHVVEVELYVASAAVVAESLGCILLRIGEDDPEAAVAVDVCIPSSRMTFLPRLGVSRTVK
ncbi:MAG: hypothetical protein LKE40_12175 [Spirochaetia bacterium]|jgi:hypothetical protein|nr:hypothetical protein [Spirochaetia bacterium]